MKFTQTIRDFINRKTLVDRADTTLTAAYVSQGEIDVSAYKTVAIYPIWTKGDETSAELKITELHTTGGSEYQLGDYTNVAGALAEEAFEITYTVTGKKTPIMVDVTGTSIIKIYVKATGGTPDGKIQIDYIGSNSS